MEGCAEGEAEGLEVVQVDAWVEAEGAVLGAPVCEGGNGVFWENGVLY